MKIFQLISVIAVIGIGLCDSAEAVPVKYEWSSTNGFLSSANETAIEAITGQSAFSITTPGGIRWVVPGNMNGTFTYDKDNADPPVQFGNFTHYIGANLAPTASLFSATGLVGTLTVDVGRVIVSNSGGGASGNQDVVNVSMCCGTVFAVGPWQATGSGVAWVGEGFQNDQNLPMALPPVGAPLPLGLFSFFNSTTRENVLIISVNLDFDEAAQTVEIDVKPGSDPNNAIEPMSNGVIPVAVLGSIDFDATLVDFSTVEFGPGAAAPAHDGHVEDVNDDGFVDMVFHFNSQDTGIGCGDIEATLSGETFGEDSFTGTDSVNTVGCH